MMPAAASALCSMGWRPIMITGMLRDQLTRHFATPMNIEDQDLRRLVWREDERSAILIESIYRRRADLLQKRPAVIIKPNSRRNLRLGILDFAGTTAQGHRLFKTYWVGSHTLFCIHGSGASADILATEVQRELTEFAEALREELGLHLFQVTEVGAVASVEEARENFVVPVSVGWAYEESWQLELESRKLRTVALSVLLDGALV